MRALLDSDPQSYDEAQRDVLRTKLKPLVDLYERLG